MATYEIDPAAGTLKVSGELLGEDETHLRQECDELLRGPAKTMTIDPSCQARWSPWICFLRGPSRLFETYRHKSPATRYGADLDPRHLSTAKHKWGAKKQVGRNCGAGFNLPKHRLKSAPRLAAHFDTLIALGCTKRRVACALEQFKRAASDRSSTTAT